MFRVEVLSGAETSCRFVRIHSSGFATRRGPVEWCELARKPAPRVHFEEQSFESDPRQAEAGASRLDASGRVPSAERRQRRPRNNELVGKEMESENCFMEQSRKGYEGRERLRCVKLRGPEGAQRLSSGLRAPSDRGADEVRPA
jgi:hypothetical protein